MNYEGLKKKWKDVSQTRSWLVESLRTHLLPLLMQQGFALAPLAGHGPADREFVQSLPFGRLRRIREGGAVDLVEIEFARYRRAAFRVSAGVAPREGLMTLTGHLAAEDAHVGWLNEYFTMYDSTWRRKWFSVSHWPYQSLVQGDYEKPALRAASFLPELELGLREGKLGPHVWRTLIPRPSIAESKL